eukprot:gnl/TRDRNA2_/TRDRNA2_126728_c1_seq1.p1 gnl/TRDRNA2_/TRDRNA2_126728_c1~~gnl/TRDRNA2_/TRDRNA2_126728_c1_seq1.p1  ORF type:complete len:834 (+),score=62.13 gnl/TRDRNA2_/TRDRNA2_126728_c1_seq1:322-2502(+)
MAAYGALSPRRPLSPSLSSCASHFGPVPRAPSPRRPETTSLPSGAVHVGRVLSRAASVPSGLTRHGPTPPALSPRREPSPSELSSAAHARKVSPGRLMHAALSPRRTHSPSSRSSAAQFVLVDSAAPPSRKRSHSPSLPSSAAHFMQMAPAASSRRLPSTGPTTQVGPSGSSHMGRAGLVVPCSSAVSVQMGRTGMVTPRSPPVGGQNTGAIAGQTGFLTPSIPGFNTGRQNRVLPPKNQTHSAPVASGMVHSNSSASVAGSGVVASQNQIPAAPKIQAPAKMPQGSIPAASPLSTLDRTATPCSKLAEEPDSEPDGQPVPVRAICFVPAALQAENSDPECWSMLDQVPLPASAGTAATGSEASPACQPEVCTAAPKATVSRLLARELLRRVYAKAAGPNAETVALSSPGRTAGNRSGRSSTVRSPASVDTEPPEPQSLPAVPRRSAHFMPAGEGRGTAPWSDEKEGEAPITKAPSPAPPQLMPPARHVQRTASCGVSMSPAVPSSPPIPGHQLHPMSARWPWTRVRAPREILGQPPPPAASTLLAPQHQMQRATSVGATWRLATEAISSPRVPSTPPTQAIQSPRGSAAQTPRSHRVVSCMRSASEGRLWMMPVVAKEATPQGSKVAVSSFASSLLHAANALSQVALPQRSREKQPKLSSTQDRPVSNQLRHVCPTRRNHAQSTGPPPRCNVGERARLSQYVQDLECLQHQESQSSSTRKKRLSL